MFPIADNAIDRIDPVHLTAIRYALAVVFFFAILWAVEGRGALGFDGRFKQAFFLGTVGFALFNVMTFIALEHTKPQNAALVVATTPLVTALVLWVRKGQRPSAALLACIAVAFTGVALVITHGDPLAFFDGGVGAGELMVLVGVIGWIRYTMGAAEIAAWSPLRYTTLTAAAGTLTIIAAALVSGWAGWEASPSGADLGARWEDIAFMVLAGSVVAVVAWNEGVRRIGTQNAALFMNLVPVTTFTVQIARGYSPGFAEIAGAALTVAALTAANIVGRRAEVARAAANGVPSAPWQPQQYAASGTS
jgi:drug/metabolite transporter (DMT)-like permease